MRAALTGQPDAGPIPRDYDVHRAVPHVAALFTERVEDYRATVRRVGPAELPDAIAAELAGLRIAVPADLPTPWLADGVHWLPDDPPLGVDRLDGADGVLTGCAIGIAETGTIVLDAGATQGRRALTLVPDLHLCVVRTDQLVVTVPEAVARLEPTRPLTFISGPSATSDIELDRVEGVHGPRTLRVLLVG